MGFIEIIGEFFNPGPVGEVDFKDNETEVSRDFITLRFILSVIIIGLFEYFVAFHSGSQKDFLSILTPNIVFVVYLIISYLIKVRPEYRNTGWLPFIIDNPFRISDDYNRFLAVLNILCIPGKFLSRSVVMFFKNKSNSRFD